MVCTAVLTFFFHVRSLIVTYHSFREPHLHPSPVFFFLPPPTKIKDERIAEEFVNRLGGDLGDLGALENPEELWSAYKTTILDISSAGLGIRGS